MMGHQIIPQPDGKLAVFSSFSDAWIITGASPEELKEYYAGKAADEARKSTQETLDLVLSGARTYCQFTMSFEEANDHVRIGVKWIDGAWTTDERQLWCMDCGGNHADGSCNVVDSQ